MAYTIGEIDQMPASVYLDKFNNEPGFRDEVDRLEEERQAHTPKMYEVPETSSRAQAQARERQAFVEQFDGPTPVVESSAPAVEEPVVETPVVEAPVVAPVPAMKDFEIRYQPADKEGRPVGGEQVIRYSADSELPKDHPLIKQLINNHIAATVRLRELNQRVQILEHPDVAAENVPDDEMVMFEPRSLTNEEMAQIGQDLQNPETAGAAYKRLQEATYGASAETVARVLNKVQQETAKASATVEVDAFRQLRPQYYHCRDNSDAIIAYMKRKGRTQPVRENFVWAYDELSAMGALIARPRADLVSPVVEPALVPAAPIVREEMASAPAVAPATANPQPSQIPESRIAPPVSEQAKRPESVPVATGLTRKNASEGEPMSVEQQTVAELDEKFAIEVPDLNSQGRPTGRRITIKGPAAPDRYPADLLKRCILEDDANDTGFRQWLDSCDKRNMEAKLRRSRR